MASKWTRPPEKLVKAFDCALAGFPDAERRPMFGCPCVFLNGNMVCGLHEDPWIVRLDPAQRKARQDAFEEGAATLKASRLK